MDVKRELNLSDVLQKKSCFLWGPRQTGKTYLINKTLGDYRCYNLLKTDVFLKLSRAPHRIREEIKESEKIVIIDEIQKLPILLDEVHSLIEEKGVHFLLTGSSARKLKRKGTNLLGGRARTKRLMPFIFRELGDQFDLLKSLDIGLIPSIFSSDSPYEDLDAYVGTYLKEEIAAEALVRNIPAFSRFLQVAGLSNGKILNYSNIASDAEIAKSTVQQYFQVLRDTLIGDDLPPWKKTKKRKPFSTSKFFLFDGGIARCLQGRQGLKIQSPEFGEAFENYLFHELKAYNCYSGGGELSYWRSASGFEVDFILNDNTAIEVKGKSNISAKDHKGLRALQEEKILKRYILVCLEDTPRLINGIQILPWQEFLSRLWEGEFK